MRRSLKGLVVALVVTCVPMFAVAGNQEVAQQIARNMKSSGRMSDYKIGVKFQDGTAWLSGRVRDEEQMNTALRLAISTPGVERVVNNLVTGSAEQVAQQQPAEKPAPLADPVPKTGQAEKVAISFTPSPARQVSALESNLTPMDEMPQPMPMGAAPRGTPRPTRVAYRQEPVPATPGVPPNGVPAGSMPAAGVPGPPLPMYAPGVGGATAPVRYDRPCMPNYAWPSYASYPNYAGVTYPVQYSPTAWPFIGPFYPYPQVPLGWRKVTLEWDDGWWFLDFKDRPSSWESPIGRWY